MTQEKQIKNLEKRIDLLCECIDYLMVCLRAKDIDREEWQTTDFNGRYYHPKRENFTKAEEKLNEARYDPR